MKPLSRLVPILWLTVVFGGISGCAHYEVNTGRGDIPGYYIRSEMQEADRAVENARRSGKADACPAEFKAAEDAKNHAYDVFRACHTEEGVALAKQATAKANALCPPKPTPPPVVAPAPKPVPPPPPPISSFTVTRATVTKGEPVTLVWSSQNASRCDIQPGIGVVEPQGSMSVVPEENTTYTLSCSGAGGTTQSSAKVEVAAPVVRQKLSPEKLCSPSVIDIQFDFDKADIKPQYYDELDKWGEALKEFPKAKGTVEGYTDNVGTRAHNMKLSQQRAENVRTYLVDKFGIDPDRISAKGFGEDQPIASNKTAAGRQQNRRIQGNFICE
ncbi:OmpA family protein [Geobacter sp. SVR]|uniref:OmpA family protein n=1 Tax=Geobacter sp. SVR TaxID=2495594 RepID=UPI00143EFCFD|nr:OmpA family protein [Geobacter sp. SVR]BCS54351.1 hypothetical protein GSVR_26590 [Geobacter sp. SVR]GCF87480.1 hypothetical protein GSbR_40800 [Geobacter sp. SVR]